MSFRLFDALIGRWWLEQEALEGVGGMFGVRIAPYLGEINFLPNCHDDIMQIVWLNSLTAIQDGGKGCRPEGIVAKSKPLLFDRAGERVMWKLKYKDF